MIEVVALQIIGVVRASANRRRQRQPPQGSPQPHRWPLLILRHVGTR